MKPVNKAQLLAALEQKVESHRQEAVGVFQNLSVPQLLQPATDGGWSVAQCLEHLNRYGHYYLPHIQTGLGQPLSQPAPATFRSTWLGHYFTRTMDPATNQKKYKAFKNYNPAPALDAPAVVAEFIQQQETLLTYLRQARTADLDAVKVPISVSKWIKLKLGDVLQFVIAHNERHVIQARRLRT